MKEYDRKVRKKYTNYAQWNGILSFTIIAPLRTYNHTNPGFENFPLGKKTRKVHFLSQQKLFTRNLKPRVPFCDHWRCTRREMQNNKSVDFSEPTGNGFRPEKNGGRKNVSVRKTRLRCVKKMPTKLERWWIKHEIIMSYGRITDS